MRHRVPKIWGHVHQTFLFNSQKQLVFHGRIDNAMKLMMAAREKTMINNIEKLFGQKIEKDLNHSLVAQSVEN